MTDQSYVANTDATHNDASAALLADHNQVPDKETPSHQSWLSTIVDYVPDKLGAPAVVSKLLPTVIKTAALFYPGVAGVAGYVAMSALDQAHPGDRLDNQAEDLALGAAKGALMAGAFRATAAMPSNALGLAGRGVSLGVASRFLDTGLDRNTYVDPNTGAADWTGGLTNVFKTTFQPGALAIDAATFTIAGGLAKEANVLTKGALATNYAASNAITGGIFGFSSGAFGELRQEQLKNQPVSALSVLGQGLESGAVMAVAAIPGGLKMQANAAQAAQARSHSENEQPPAKAPLGRIIPGPGHSEQTQRFYAHVADQSGGQAKEAQLSAGEAKEAQLSAGEAKVEQLTAVPAPNMSTPRIEVRMDEGGNVLFNSGPDFTAEVNDVRIPRGQDVSIKPGDKLAVDVGDNYAVWKTVSFGNVGTEPTVEGFPLTRGHSVRFDFNSLYYQPDAKGDPQGGLSLTRSRSVEGSQPGSYREPTSSIKVDATGKMTISPSMQNIFKINGKLAPQADIPIQPGDKIEADVGDRYSEWKPMNWSKIGNLPALEGRPLPPGRELRFDPDTIGFSPTVAADSQGNLVLTGPKMEQKWYIEED